MNYTTYFRQSAPSNNIKASTRLAAPKLSLSKLFASKSSSTKPPSAKRLTSKLSAAFNSKVQRIVRQVEKVDTYFDRRRIKRQEKKQTAQFAGLVSMVQHLDRCKPPTNQRPSPDINASSSFSPHKPCSPGSTTSPDKLDSPSIQPSSTEPSPLSDSSFLCKASTNKSPSPYKPCFPNKSSSSFKSSSSSKPSCSIAAFTHRGGSAACHLIDTLTTTRVADSKNHAHALSPEEPLSALKRRIVSLRLKVRSLQEKEEKSSIQTLPTVASAVLTGAHAPNPEEPLFAVKRRIISLRLKVRSLQEKEEKTSSKTLPTVASPVLTGAHVPPRTTKAIIDAARAALTLKPANLTDDSDDVFGPGSTPTEPASAPYILKASPFSKLTDDSDDVFGPGLTPTEPASAPYILKAAPFSKLTDDSDDVFGPGSTPAEPFSAAYILKPPPFLMRDLQMPTTPTLPRSQRSKRSVAATTYGRMPLTQPQPDYDGDVFYVPMETPESIYYTSRSC
jgi:hypothetical protein